MLLLGKVGEMPADLGGQRTPMADGIKKIHIIPITTPIYGQGDNGPCVVGYTKGYRLVK